MCHGVDKHGGVLTFHIEGTHIFIMTGLHRFKMDGYIKSFYKHSQMKKRTISNGKIICRQQQVDLPIKRADRRFL